jgi:hypothetical protein
MSYLPTASCVRDLKDADLARVPGKRSAKVPSSISSVPLSPRLARRHGRARARRRKVQVIETEVAKMPYGGYKAIIWGQHDEHMMDWRGCNYRYIVVKGQPRSGFTTAEAAEDWWYTLSGEFQQEELDRAYMTNGSHLPDFGGPEHCKRLEKEASPQAPGPG